PQRGRFPFRVLVGKPYAELDGERWACPVFLEGLDRRGPDIRGIDSMQALTLAIHFAQSALQSFVGQGLMLYWPDGKPASVEQIFDSHQKGDA
ncbi:DUF6968 family protein, partial [Staphylococcus aureus]|uniref:DUF6968 family protein n=1 Tax=Staphylococcus aureus TaxID=1280 RepID=UPI0039BDEB90